jgi:hypothetical protein
MRGSSTPSRRINLRTTKLAQIVSYLRVQIRVLRPLLPVGLREQIYFLGTGPSIENTPIDLTLSEIQQSSCFTRSA